MIYSAFYNRWHADDLVNAVVVVIGVSERGLRRCLPLYKMIDGAE